MTRKPKYAYSEYEFPKGIWNFVVWEKGTWPQVPITTGHGYDTVQEAVVEAYEEMLKLEDGK